MKTRKAPAAKNSLEITLNVLGYKEHSEWVALALEMDLRGYGATLNDALGELRELVGMKVSFAMHKRQPELIMKPADISRSPNARLVHHVFSCPHPFEVPARERDQPRDIAGPATTLARLSRPGNAPPRG